MDHTDVTPAISPPHRDRATDLLKHISKPGCRRFFSLDSPNHHLSSLPNHHIIMLYVVGLGLSDEKDITVKGLEVSLPKIIRLLVHVLYSTNPTGG